MSSSSDDGGSVIVEVGSLGEPEEGCRSLGGQVQAEEEDIHERVIGMTSDDSGLRLRSGQKEDRISHSNRNSNFRSIWVEPGEGIGHKELVLEVEVKSLGRVKEG